VRSIISVTILLIASVAQVFPQQAAEPLSLDDCIRLARNAQSSIDVASRETEIARSEVNHAIASFLPQAELNNTYTYNSPLKRNPEEASFISLDGFREYNTQLTAVQELDISGKLRAELARARADRDAAAASLNLNRRDLKRAVSASYYGVLLARHLVGSAKDALEEAQAFAERTRLLSDQGEASKADLYKALSEVASFEQSLSAAELDAEIANHDLASFWTDQVADALVLEDVLA
jgi:outer membrane protein